MYSSAVFLALLQPSIDAYLQNSIVNGIGAELVPRNPSSSLPNSEVFFKIK